MNTFALILQLCGLLNGAHACEYYTLDDKITEVQCLRDIVDIHNHEFSPHYYTISDHGSKWDEILFTKLNCDVSQ